MVAFSGHLLAFASPLACLLSIGESPWLVIAVIALSFIVHPVLDESLHALSATGLPGTSTRRIPAWAYNLFLYLGAPVHCLVLVHGLTSGTGDWPRVLATGVLCGISGGVLAIAVSHELIHSSGRFDRTLGRALLHAANYPHFHIEHLWHHIAVASPDDADTARKDESIYRFWIRSIIQGWLQCWKLKRAKMIRLSALHLVLWTLIVGLGGIRWGVVFALQGCVTVLMLKWINYVEHYGLDRRRPDGSLAPVSELDAWDTTHAFSNWVLFNLGYHSQHHLTPRIPYHRLPESRSRWQTLPSGYSSMMLKALWPAHWVRTMSPLLEARSNARTNRGGKC